MRSSERDDGRVQATGAVLFPRGAGLSNKAGGDESLATRSVDEEPKRKIINRYANPFFHRRTDKWLALISCKAKARRNICYSIKYLVEYATVFEEDPLIVKKKLFLERALCVLGVL